VLSIFILLFVELLNAIFIILQYYIERTENRVHLQQQQHQEQQRRYPWRERKALIQQQQQQRHYPARERRAPNRLTYNWNAVY